MIDATWEEPLIQAVYGGSRAPPLCSCRPFLMMEGPPHFYSPSLSPRPKCGCGKALPFVATFNYIMFLEGREGSHLAQSEEMNLVQ